MLHRALCNLRPHAVASMYSVVVRNILQHKLEQRCCASWSPFCITAESQLRVRNEKVCVVKSVVASAVATACKHAPGVRLEERKAWIASRHTFERCPHDSLTQPISSLQIKVLARARVKSTAPAFPRSQSEAVESSECPRSMLRHLPARD